MIEALNEFAVRAKLNVKSFALTSHERTCSDSKYVCEGTFFYVGSMLQVPQPGIPGSGVVYWQRLSQLDFRELASYVAS